MHMIMNGVVTTEPCPQCGAAATCQHGHDDARRRRHLWRCPACGDTSSAVGYACADCGVMLPEHAIANGAAVVEIATGARGKVIKRCLLLGDTLEPACTVRFEDGRELLRLESEIRAVTTKACPRCGEPATFAGVIREDPRYPAREAPEVMQGGFIGWGMTTIERPPVVVWRGVWRCPNQHETTG